jgi:hypothetical protein
MAVTSTRSIAIQFSGDVVAQNTFAAATNAASPGQIEIKELASGANTITPPGGGSTPKAVTIIPPSGNLNTITLKGIAGDTGVVLHLTDPTTIGLNSPTATFVLSASAITTGVRLVWT